MTQAQLNEVISKAGYTPSVRGYMTETGGFAFSVESHRELMGHPKMTVEYVEKTGKVYINNK